MGRFEKILLVILLAFCVVFLTLGHHGSLVVSLWILTLTYAGGAYWLFRRPPQPAAWVRVLAGLCFGAVLYGLVDSIGLHRTWSQRLLPIPSGLLLVGLSVYWCINRHVAARVAAYRSLLVRAALLFGVGAFFAYCPITVSGYRSVLLVLNRGDELLTGNLRMYGYVQQSEEALEANECAQAVYYGRQAYAAGNQWLEADSLADRWRISGTYSNLFTAYTCQGDAAYNQQRYAEALRSYQAGHDFLVRGDHRPAGEGAPAAYWLEKEAWSLDNMALCYLKLHQLAQSDSLSMLALTTYSRLHPKADGGTARLLETLARSQAAGTQWNTSTELYRRANRILAHQPTAAATKSLTSNRIQIALNYLGQDSLLQARRLLHTLTFSADDSANRYKARLYEGICLYKQSHYGQAGQLLVENLHYYQAHADTEWISQVACQLLLARNALALASYPQAQAYVAAAQATVIRKLGPDSRENARCVEINAAVSKALGRYSEAARAYAHATTLFRAGGNQEDPAMAGVLTELADLAVIQGDVPAAQRDIATALALVAANGVVKSPTQTGLLNTAAYIDYAAGHSAAARGKYRQTVALNHRFGQSRSVTTAAAWNGLALLALEQRNFRAADSLLTASVALHEALLGELHPTTATVYLNEGLLHLQQGELLEAQRLIQKAQRIAEAKLPADHDLFGDVAGALGDVAQQQGQLPVARSHYQRALLLYARKFSPDHWKVKRIRRKLSFS